MATASWLVFTEVDAGGTWSLFETIGNDPRQALENALEPEQGYGTPDRRAIVCPVDGSKAYELTYPRHRVEVQCEIGLAGISEVA